MSVALVADAHLGGAGGSAELLARQLQALPAEGCERLVLLGDIFHVWVGEKRFETASIRRLCATFRELRDQGLGIDYIEGNRDFFLADSEYAELFSSVGSEVALVSGGVRYLAVHGDGLNPADRQYLFWRNLSKSRLSRFLMFNLPRGLAQRALDRTEARLAKTNFKHRVGIPEEELGSYADKRLAEGHDVLLMGHYHEPVEWQVAGGRVRILDAWFNSQQVEWLK